MEPQRIVQTVLALYSIDEKTIGSALGLALPLGDQNPYWAFYEAKHVGVYSSVVLSLSKADPRWRLSVDYDLDHVHYPESSIDFAPYGPLVDIRPNPDIPPEGSRTTIYDYSGYKIYFEFTSKSRLVLGVTIQQP